jgi:hypothetical protein
VDSRQSVSPLPKSPAALPPARRSQREDGPSGQFCFVCR